MKSNVFTIMKKEFARFFGDKRMLLTLLLPGLLIYVLYSFMGNAIQNMVSPEGTNLPKIYISNLPDSLKGEAMGNWEWAQLLEETELQTPVDKSAKEKVSSKEIGLYIVFPEGFDLKVQNYDVTKTTEKAPNIEVYYNASDMPSLNAYMTLMSFLDNYESSLSNKFDINADVANSNLATEDEVSANIISSLMPMLLLMLLFSGCMGIAPESIAGEKERGTIGTLLVSPLKRSELAIGKILSLGVLAFLVGIVSSVSTILALPKLMGNTGDLKINIYTARDYFLLALVILSTLLLIVSLISIISAFAKSVKEAGTAVMPLMIVTMLVGVTGMFGSIQKNQTMYLIPLYNSVQCMSGIFSLDYSGISILITVISNITYAAIGGFILTRMFNSEKVMFAK